MTSSSCIFTLLILFANVSWVMSWCHPDKRTDNPHGRCCVFPFVYGGKTYNSCTKVAHHIFWCSLDKVYKGHWANCVNPCTNNPCQNGGVCTVTGDDSYSCKCAEGFYGNNCEKALPCPPGKTTDNPHGRCCVFPFVYRGKKYESCTKVAHHRLWCSLDKVYKGHWANCVNPCTNNPCQNGGVCTVTGDDSYSCKCAEGYHGNNCEKVSPCKLLPCKNGGTCTMSGPDSFFCTCTDEFKGETCEKRLPCPPGKKTDNPHGRCCVFPFVYGGKKYESCTKVAHNRLWCSLDNVYKGHWANCVNPCTNNPCQNGGVCTVTGDDSYSCKCTDGYFGNNCEKASPCKSLPCKNGGTCTMSGPDSFCCTCTDEFKGETCEKRLPCPSGKKTDNPHGRCCVFPFVYGGKKYESCTKVAHNRLWCSLDKVYKGHWANCVNPCTNNPCQNGGVCTVTGDDSYSCKCAEGYCGKSCEKAVEWKSEGCYKEHKRARKMVLGYKFATVQRKKRKIKEVFDICKVAAEKKGYKIFGIRNMKGCFTTSDGEVHNFKKYGTSSNCKVDYNGLGVGKKLANFVFTRL